ncbi:MAG: hypothetical protein IJR61_03995 [Clostridia bacterium]|nr:hypothetical protein [Clostridia bacterium]
MKYFTLLPFAARLLLSGAPFLAASALLSLVLYRFITRAKALGNMINIAVFACFTGFTAYVMSSAAEPSSYPLPVPWAAFLAISSAAVSYSAFSVAALRKKSGGRLSPSSVKETLDNLGTGVCFADGSGRLILVNLTFAWLASDLIGSYPQTADEILSALSAPEKNGAEKLGDFYRFPDGKVWKFAVAQLSGGSLSGFTQITAQDVTEIYLANEEIKRENEEIRGAIAKTGEMLARLPDRIREQETLSMKIRVHNEIGASLVALARVLNSSGETVDEQLEKLQYAVWHFTGGAADGNFDTLRLKARDMGVSVTLEGTLPQGDIARKTVILAAEECVTNCAKHARGSRVNIAITREKGGFYRAVFTNDGEIPRGKITEGGGLTSLRRSVENAGGRMEVTGVPAFALAIEIPDEKEKI